MRYALRTYVAGIGLAAALTALTAIADETPARRALAWACMDSSSEIGSLQRTFPGSSLLDVRVRSFRGQPGRSQHVLGLPSGGELRITKVFPLGQLRRVSIEFYTPRSGGGLRPYEAIGGDGACREIETRRIDYDLADRAEHLIIRRGDDHQDVPLNPPVPPGRDPGGVLVAVIDTGLNYQLPNIAARLARDEGGSILGYDFWDDDARPFDIDTGRSPFFPLHHGTAVTSIILREAPNARIAPYRFPRPDMARMADVVAHADAVGARIVNLAMGSNKAEDWRAFEFAARGRPHMLFIVSAGNNGRDIDRSPVYPAALALTNMVTVTSADAFGKLAEGSNWGRTHVDIMAPGERVAVIDHRGVDIQASGSSFVVPRIAALAARWLAANPAWTAKKLKQAILSRARPSPRQSILPLAYGWIPDPTDDYLP
tara:strand:+ start:163 stop:1446 length:1284 start_codon:yes stop_codon:yes gene_type:complete